MAETRANAALLPDRGIVAVSGADAATFLDNLLTNSVDKLDEGDARFAALLTPQGKILFEFFAVRTETGFLLDTRRDKVADLVKRLAMYKLRAKVDIIDLSERSAVAAVWWTPAGATPTSFSYEAKVRASFADPRDPRLGLRLLLEVEGTTPPLTGLSGVSLAADPRGYQDQRIGLSIPSGGDDYALGDTYPHEANYDLLHGVSFTKGCFVGQEVVARMQNKTVVRKRIVRLTGSGLKPGAEVKVGDAGIGRVGSSDNTHALALLRLDRAAEAIDARRPITVDGQPIEVDPAAIARYQHAAASKPVIDL